MQEARTVKQVPKIFAEWRSSVFDREGAPRREDRSGFHLGNPDTPIIPMSLQYDRIDNFWFVLGMKSITLQP